MVYPVLLLFLIFGYCGSLASRVMTRQNGQMLGAMLFFVPLIGFLVVLGRWNGFAEFAIGVYFALIACPFGAGMGLCACRRRAH